MADTSIFRIPATEFVKVSASRRLWSVAWIPALLIIAAAIAGAADSRFWFLGLMFIFIVYPMAMSMAWFRLVGHPSMELLLRPQSWTLDGDSLIVRFHNYEPEEKECEPAVKETVVFPAGILDDAESHRKFTIIPVPENKYRIQFLLIPAGQAATLINPANAS